MNKFVCTTLFLDIGGVLLTNGWDRHSRERTAKIFDLDYTEMTKRHALIFDTYEIGKITLDTYLSHVVFYIPRQFSPEEFKICMFSQSQAYPNMLQYMREIKKRYLLQIVAVSNEGRELMDYRIKHFQLKEFIDFFVCSGFIGLRKPDEGIYRLALDMAQARPEEVIYIDDREMLIEIGSQLGLQTIQHLTLEKTQNILNDFLSGTPYRKDA